MCDNFGVLIIRMSDRFLTDYIEPREWNKIKYSMSNGGTGKECNKVNDLLHNKCLTTDLTLCTSSVAEFADTNHNWQG